MPGPVKRINSQRDAVFRVLKVGVLVIFDCKDRSQINHELNSK